MVDRLIKQWDADPNGEVVVKLFEQPGFIAALRGLVTPRVVDVPSATAPHLYEAVPMVIKGNQRIEVIQAGEIVMKG